MSKSAEGTESGEVASPPLPAETGNVLTVLVNPEDTVGIPIEPVFISLGLALKSFRADVGGTPA